MQVSIILLTYYPDPFQLRQSLIAAAQQTGVEFEIIVSDDGSQTKDFSFIPALMQEYGIRNYRIIENEQNQGTVKNCLGAIRQAQGEYIFLTSPGDYLFDCNTMADFYQYAVTNNAKLVFGNAVYYRPGDPDPVLTRESSVVYAPHIYAPGVPTAAAKTHFYGDNWPIGAGYFRHRETVLPYFEAVSQHSVYVEDNTTTAYAMADGISLCHYDRNIVWYEDGTGVSTGASEKWRVRIAQDVRLSYEALQKKHPKNPYVDYAFHNAGIPERKKRLIYQLTHHPLIFLRHQLGKRTARPVPVRCSAQDLAYLKNLCNDPTKE